MVNAKQVLYFEVKLYDFLQGQNESMVSKENLDQMFLG